MPWKSHLYTLEEELAIDPAASILFVLYEDDRERKWRIQAVSKAPGRSVRGAAAWTASAAAGPRWREGGRWEPLPSP